MAQLPPNIYEQQSANKRNTIIVMGMFTAFVGFLGFGVDAFVLGTEAQFPIATFIALCIGAGSAYWGLANGATTVLAASSAKPVPLDDPKYQQLRNVVDEMTIASGMPKPQLFVVPDADPNAFATGRDPGCACIAVTEGLVEKLSREELQAVIAHEMSHVRNYDIRMMTVVAALGGAVMLLSEFGLRAMRFGGGGKKRGRDGLGPILLVFWLVAMVLAPLITQLLSMAVSRQREYLADASGAELTRNPLALASALEKIDSAVEPTRSIKKGTGHLCIADPLGRSVNSKEGSLADLFATHPPIGKRILLLKAMAYQHA
jgi:heat shock protein HtpX